MTKEEPENKCTERAKIFQQAMESCKSSNPMDCIEWFADKILELEQKLEQTEKDLTDYQFNYPKIKDLEWQLQEVAKDNDNYQKENAELKQKIKYWKTEYEKLFNEDEDDNPLMQEAFKDGAEFGYNKANEWHYVKDGLPISDKDKFYFVVDKWNEPMVAVFYEGVWSNYSVIDEVIAWKEIVLPELKEM